MIANACLGIILCRRTFSGEIRLLERFSCIGQNKAVQKRANNSFSFYLSSINNCETTRRRFASRVPDETAQAERFGKEYVEGEQQKLVI
jgi:hypothetical protein